MTRRKTPLTLTYIMSALCICGWVYIMHAFFQPSGYLFLIVLFIPVIVLIVLPAFMQRRLGNAVGYIIRSVRCIFPHHLQQPANRDHEDERFYEQGYRVVSSSALVTKKAHEEETVHNPELPQASYPLKPPSMEI